MSGRSQAGRDRTGHRKAATAGAVLLALLSSLAGCSCQAQSAPAPSGTPTLSPTSASPSVTPTRTHSATPTPSNTPAPSHGVPGPTPTPPSGGLTLRQEAGQLFLVAAKANGSDLGAASAALQAGVGNFYLNGRTTAGVAATADVVAQLRGAVSSATPLAPLIASDQEGGQVQVLRGPGFSVIPSALQQGQLAPATLRADSQQWGSELRAAGLTMDLAPVLDTVPSAAFAPQNIPIGYYQRNYGFTPAAVSQSGNAFAQGMRAAGVRPVVKHFPGLGRVTANTDTSSDVRDTQTTRTDPYLQPFRDAVNSGVNWVMVSNAFYDRIDPARMAPFSPVIIGGMLRQDLGFQGVVMSDDLCSAVQLSGVSVTDRAIGFLEAGGTMAICADSGMAVQMLDAVVAQAQQDPAFRAVVENAFRLVQQTKAKGA
ncbi:MULTISPECIES: glycoside hydrolase family 3 N-terminal domain-containing protein [Arthrobacter]|uniref:beta-N-acetylhexosaminidase n=2 Tax=Arthrobacter TaxID=1663 RepID=A0ABU9KJS9_9MICC|nr:glycoside hydrolase family 3 N-terminal domain-containing protein [Arthrobacter sp. YJM1]MDP5227177.1 glycoside hydrolase family 3 N-terminal domain-containing protein [Arthrobacter sp. YJM1]